MTTAKPPAGFEMRRPARSFLRTTRDVLLTPARFFGDVRGEASYAGPVVYAVVCQVAAVLLAGLYDFARTTAGDGAGEISVLGIDGAAGALLWGLWLLGLAPLYALVTLAVGAGVYQLLVVLLVGRRNGGYGSTLRVTGYLSAISLVIWMPVVGLLAGLWGVWVNAAGLKELHSTTTTRAVLVAAVPYVLALVWSIFTILSGQTVFWEFLVGGGTNFPTTEDPLLPAA